MNPMDDDRDELAEDDRHGSSVKDVEAIDLDAAADLEVDGEDELTSDDLTDDEAEEQEGEAEDVDAAKAKVPGRKKAKPEDKPFSDYETGVKNDADWGNEAAGEGEITSRVGRNAGPMAGAAAEREIERIDRDHRKPRGSRAPAPPSHKRKKTRPTVRPTVRRRAKAK